MGVKESLKNVAARIGGVDAANVRDINAPKWSKLYEDVGDYGPEQITPYTDFYKGMVMDENKRGYSPETVQNMRGKQTGAIAGAMRSADESTGRAIAASGMGNTSMPINAAKQRGYQTASLMREANRDVDLAQAQAQREDLWQASQAWQQGINMRQNLFNTQMNALQGEMNAMTRPAEIESMQIPALLGAHETSFWGDFSDIANSFANLIGSGRGLFAPTPTTPTNPEPTYGE